MAAGSFFVLVNIVIVMIAYEIHLGINCGKGLSRPVLRLNDEAKDGAISVDDQVLGIYCHCIFDHSEALTAFIDLRP